MRDHDSPKGGVEVLCHLIFHGEEFDIEKIRRLVVLLNSTQLIDKIKIVDGYSKKEIAEIIKGFINENVTLVKNECVETYSQYSRDNSLYHATPIKAEIEDPEMSNIKQAAALDSEDTAENPEAYSNNKSDDNALDDANTITRSICSSDQPQSSVQRMSQFSMAKYHNITSRVSARSTKIT